MSWLDPQHSPHVLQGSGDNSFPFVRSLSGDFPRKKYHRRTDELKTVVHWGQRKLLMSEIEFLTLANEPNAVVVYAGASPGTHVQILSELFPECLFVLVDPAPFTVQPSRKIVLKQIMFTDKLAKQLRRKYSSRPILFISDIRSADEGIDNEETMQAKVESDMEAQARWHDAIKAAKSMLKFRLPYTAGRTEYLDGDLRLPVWGPITTTECRLIVEQGARLRMYSHKRHEEQMFFFNKVARSSLYRHGVMHAEGLDHCYDCSAEVHILTEYLRWSGQRRKLNQKICTLSKRISAALSTYRTLASPNPEPGHRVKLIRQNQWIEGQPAYKCCRKC